MSGFSAEWLSLRAGADAAARDAALLAAAQARLAPLGRPLIADLGCGAGATLDALAPLAPRARWRLIDHDPALLDLAGARAEALGVRAERRRLNLAEGLEAAVADADLVTASALIDLGAQTWIETLASAIAAARAATYVALTYDGREIWAPDDPEDKAVLAALHADMRRDKGLGPALGPAAPARFAAALRRRGYAVRSAASDWRLGPQDAALIAELARGIGDAVAPALGDDRARAWSARRAEARSVTIGHIDIFATPL